MKSKHTVATMTKRKVKTYNTNMYAFSEHVQMMVEADSIFYLKDIEALVDDVNLIANLNRIEKKYAQISRLNFKELKCLYKYLSARTAAARERAQDQLLAIQEISTELINREIS